MDDKGKTTGNRNTHAMILTVIGIILLILGILIVSIHGAPLRGSGVGTIAIIAGCYLLLPSGFILNVNNESIFIISFISFFFTDYPKRSIS